jgi:hypothetical protein
VPLPADNSARGVAAARRQQVLCNSLQGLSAAGRPPGRRAPRAASRRLRASALLGPSLLQDCRAIEIHRTGCNTTGCSLIWLIQASKSPTKYEMTQSLVSNFLWFQCSIFCVFVM